LPLYLGIDPGIGITGYGLIEEKRDGALSAVAYGVIETPKTHTLVRRLQTLRDELRALIATWSPAEAGIEAIFFATNARTIIPVAQARGVALLTLADAGLAIGEYTPLQVKQAVSGYGQADKRQMQEMTRLLLQLPGLPKPDDAADALAVAITHIHSRRLTRLQG